MWSKPLLCRFRQSEEIPQRQVSQGFAAFRLALPRIPTRHSQTTRATNCANPGFLVIQFCTRCGQTCGQAFFLTTSTCGGSAFIVGVSRDCGHGIFRLEGGATRSQTRRDTNFAIPGYSISAMIPRRRGKTRIFCLWSFYISPILPCRAEKSNRKRAIFCPLSAAFLYRSLAVSPAGPAAALHLLGTDLRRWTAGTCRPSAAQGFARWKAPARCPLCGGRRPRAQSVPSARQERCSVLRGIRS